MRGWTNLLWWRILDEVDAFFDVAFQALVASLKKLLLLVGDTLQDINSLLCSIRLFSQR